MKTTYFPLFLTITLLLIGSTLMAQSFKQDAQKAQRQFTVPPKKTDDPTNLETWTKKQKKTWGKTKTGSEEMIVLEQKRTLEKTSGWGKDKSKQGEEVIELNKSEFKKLDPQTLKRRMNYFYDGSWNRLLTRAKEERKMIFVDVVTDWCRVCKQMEHETFADPKVKETMLNNNFLAYQLNAEKEVAVAKKYGVSSYPTFLFINPNGEEVDRIAGYLTMDGIIKQIQTHKLKAPNTRYTEFR